MKLKKTILIVDDDEGMRDTLSAILKSDYDVRVAATGEEGLRVLKNTDVNLILLDFRMPGMTGLEVLKLVREHYNLVEVIMVSAVNEIEVAVQAMKDGTYHYITKEFDCDGLRSSVRNALRRQDLSRQVMSLNAQVADLNDREFVLRPSGPIRTISELVNKVAKPPATVLILSESGTGKELLARRLPGESGKENAPFCARQPGGRSQGIGGKHAVSHERGAYKQQLRKFKLAAGGTFFLDEIGDLEFKL